MATIRVEFRVCRRMRSAAFGLQRNNVTGGSARSLTIVTTHVGIIVLSFVARLPHGLPSWPDPGLTN